MARKRPNPGLNIVPSEKEQMSSVPEPKPSPEKSENVRIERAGFIADVLVSNSPFGHIFHYVIQRKGSPEIVHWGHEVSMQRAKECVEEFLDDFGKLKQA